MSEWMLLLMFIPTFFVISVSPGLCMMLALSFGASLGVRRSLWVIAGEVAGVSLIALTALLGYTQVLVEQPLLMQLFKYLGALYLLWMGVDGWRNASTSLAAVQADSRSGELMLRGFSVAISNPKSWLFMMTLLPPFISPSLPLGMQTLLLVSLVALIECLNLLIYAYGGHRVNQLLLVKGRGAWLGRVSSLMMVSIALFWLLS